MTSRWTNRHLILPIHHHLIRTLTLAGALVISHAMNKGYGEAIKSCSDAAAKANSADILFTLGGDGQHAQMKFVSF